MIQQVLHYLMKSCPTLLVHLGTVEWCSGTCRHIIVVQEPAERSMNRVWFLAEFTVQLHIVGSFRFKLSTRTHASRVTCKFSNFRGSYLKSSAVLTTLLNFNVAPRSSVLIGTVERSSVTCIRRHSTVVRMCVSPRLFSWVWLNYVQPEQFTTAIAIKTLLYGRIKPLSFTHTSILELMNVSRGNKWSKQPIILM